MQKSDTGSTGQTRGLSQLQSRRSGRANGSMGLESGLSVSSTSAAAASTAPPGRNYRDVNDLEPESCTSTIDKSPMHVLQPPTSLATAVEIHSASTMSEGQSKHSPNTPMQLTRRDPASLPRAAQVGSVRQPRRLHNSTHIQFAASILETFPHGFPAEHPSPSREMRGTHGIHELALASAPQLTRELMDALPPERRDTLNAVDAASGFSPGSTHAGAQRRGGDTSSALAAAAFDLTPRAGEAAVAELQAGRGPRGPGAGTRSASASIRSASARISDGLGPRAGDSLSITDPAHGDGGGAHVSSIHLSSFDRAAGSGSEIDALDVMGGRGASAGMVPAGSSGAMLLPPSGRNAFMPGTSAAQVRGANISSRWLQPRNQDPAQQVGSAWRLQSSQGSDLTSGDITGTPDTDMTQTRLPLPPGNLGSHSPNIGASPMLLTPRPMAVGGQGAPLAAPAVERTDSGARASGDTDPPGAAMYALFKYRARVAAQAQAGASGGTDTASGMAGGPATMGEVSAGQSSWLDGTGDLTPPPPHASSDEKLDHIDAQLDSLSRAVVLHVYELFGGSERRRGGSLPNLPVCSHAPFDGLGACGRGCRASFRNSYTCSVVHCSCRYFSWTWQLRTASSEPPAAHACSVLIH